MTAPRRPASAARVVLALLALTLLGCSDGGGADEAAPSSTEAPATTGGAEPGAPDGDRPDAEAPPVEEVAAGDDLYAVPDPIPDVEPGTLLRRQEIVPTLVEGARSYRIMHTSRSLQGEPIVVTGTALVPDGPAPAEGRVTLTLAHGTTGIADECAPSKDTPAGEISLMGRAVESGWLVVMSDYEGMGTPGRHPYLVGESEGRSVLDAARAAAQLPEASAGDQLLIAGYSQGGHGAAWAHQIAPDWAPELDVVGTFSGAPASEIDITLRAAPRLPQAGFAYMIIAGMAAAYPEADPADVLTEEGRRRLDAVDDGCARDVFAAVAGVPASELVKPGSFEEGIWGELAEANNAGTAATDAPLLVIHSEADQTVPVIFSQIMTERLCGLGQVVERRVPTAGQGHTEAAPGAYRDALTWFEGLLAGEAPVDSCG